MLQVNIICEEENVCNLKKQKQPEKYFDLKSVENIVVKQFPLWTDHVFRVTKINHDFENMVIIAKLATKKGQYSIYLTFCPEVALI